MPAGLDTEQLGQLLNDWAATIPVRDQVNGRWLTLTLAQLDDLAPLRGAYWRGVYTERYRLGGALPLRLPAEDVSAHAEPAAQDVSGHQPQHDPPDEDRKPPPG